MALYQNRYSGNNPAGDTFVFGWWMTSGDTTATINGRAVTWLTDLWNGVGGVSGIKALHPDSLTISKVTTSLIDVATGHTTDIAETDVTQTGTSTAGSLPADMTVVCTLRTANPRKSGRGRFYMPVNSVDVLTASGELATASQTILALALQAAWHTAIITPGGVPVVYSRHLRITEPILRLGIGTVLNVQTRRTNKLATVREFLTMA